MSKEETKPSPRAGRAFPLCSGLLILDITEGVSNSSLPSHWFLHAGEPLRYFMATKRGWTFPCSLLWSSAMTAALSVVVFLMLKSLLAFAANSSFLVSLPRD